MPNWVATIVEFSGDEKDIKAVLKEISGEDREFDFNKLIPMPEALNIEASSHSDMAYAYYYAKKFHRLPDNIRWIKNVQDAIDRVEKNLSISSQEMLEKGKVLHENKEKYGDINWYEWCINNWHTKWNACEVQIYDNTIEFQTAWSFASPVMEKLAELCGKHRVDFEGDWADEDMGSNTGCFHSFEGGFSYEYNTDCSKEAYETYVRCWGESECIGVNENGDYYRHDCDESCPNYKSCMG